MSDELRYLGKFATPEEIEHFRACQNAPVMYMTNPQPPGPGVPPVVPMFESAQEAVHRAALAHGLPEFAGYYGCDLRTGEFVRYD